MFEVFGIDLDKLKHFYPDSQEIIPRHIPFDIGKYVVIKSYADANHAGHM